MKVGRAGVHDGKSKVRQKKIDVESNTDFWDQNWDQFLDDEKDPDYENGNILDSLVDDGLLEKYIAP